MGVLNIKKLLVKILTALLSLASLSCISLAAAPATVNESELPNINSNSIQQDVEELRDIHNHAIKAGLCTLRGNMLEVNVDIAVLEISEEAAKKYSAFISSLNDIADLGVLTFNSDFSVSTLPAEEVTRIIYERDQAQQNTNMQSDNTFDEQNTIGNLGQLRRTPPILNAYSIAKSNWTQLINYYTAIAVTEPISAWTNAVAWWVAKVRPNGAWDYKTVSDYSPYNKLWCAVLKNTTSVKTTEWFGNYNYGFTGKVLFSQSELLNASKMVSYGYSGVPDSAEDQAAIKQGYNEAP